MFRGLAGQILDNVSRVIPTPFDDVAELEALYRRHLNQPATSPVSEGAVT